MKYISYILLTLLTLGSVACNSTKPPAYKNIQVSESLIQATTMRSDEFVLTFNPTVKDNFQTIQYTLTNTSKKRRALQVRVVFLSNEGVIIDQSAFYTEFFFPQIPITRKVTSLSPPSAIGEYRVEVLEPVRLPDNLKSTPFPQ
jgi:hypothetical protein